MKRSPIKRKPSEPIPPEVRAAVERRDRDCQAVTSWGHVCWGGLHLHHVLPRSRGGKHVEENLVVLCGKAHQYVHEHPTWAKENGYLG